MSVIMATLDDILQAIRANAEKTNAFIAFISSQKAHNAKIDTFMQKQEALNTSLIKRLATPTEESHSHHDECAAANLALQKYCHSLESENKELKSALQQLSSQVQHAIHRDAEHDLLIKGIPEKDSENLEEVLLATASFLNVDLTGDDIAQINRIRSTNPASQQPRSIHVSLGSSAKRNRLITNFKKAQELVASQIRPTFPASPIYINEWLPASTHSLYIKAKEAAHRLKYQYTWYKHGKIRIRRNSNRDTGIITINCEADLAKIVP